VSAGSGTWSSTSPQLADGTYTAQATQSDLAGNSGHSEPVTFVVDTSSPTVTLTGPPSPSNNTTPSFSGTASDSTQVTVNIYAGSKAEGTTVATATATPSGNNWSPGEASAALAEGTYTAQATQASSLGNAPGKSEAVTFTVDTTPPEVSLSPVPSPTGDSTPTLKGAAGTAPGDGKTVAVTI